MKSDGSTADYYELPEGATQLQDLISHRNMNAQMGEIFRASYRYGQADHSPMIRDIKKIIFYAQAELARLEKLEGHPPTDEIEEDESWGSPPVCFNDWNLNYQVIRECGLCKYALECEQPKRAGEL